MKKSLLIGGVVSLFIVGCCCKPAHLTCDNNECPNTQFEKVEQPQDLKKSKPVEVQKPIIKQNKNICFVRNGIDRRCILSIEASGVGVVPCNGSCSVAQAKAMARRAAIVSAYRNLAEKLYGIKINGRDTVKNMILQSSTVRAYVTGLIRGATIEEENFKDGTYTVVLSIKLDPNRWNQVLSEAGLL